MVCSPTASDTGMGEIDPPPVMGKRARWVSGRVHAATKPPHQLSACIAVVNPKRNVSCDVGSWTRTQHSALDVIQLKQDVSFWSHRSSLFRRASFQWQYFSRSVRGSHRDRTTC